MASGRKTDSSGSQEHSDRRSSNDRRIVSDRRKAKDRRAGWGKINDNLLEGALAAAATIVHKFSYPLTIIIGYVELMLKSASGKETREKLEIIKQQSQLIIKLLNDFREIEEYRTVEFSGLDILDIDSDPHETVDDKQADRQE